MFPKVIFHKAISLDGKFENFERNLFAEFSKPFRIEINAQIMDTNSISKYLELLPKEIWSEIKPEDRIIQHDDKRPILVVLDDKGSFNNWDKLLALPSWRDHIVLCTKATPVKYFEHLKERSIKFLIIGDHQVDFKTALNELNEIYSVKCVMVDVSEVFFSKMITEGLVDELSLIVYPILVGGERQNIFFSAEDIISPNDTIKLMLIDHDEINRTLIWLYYKVIKKYAEQKELGDAAINEFVMMLRTIQSIDEFKGQRQKIFEFMEHFLISSVSTLKGLVNNTMAREKVEGSLAKIQEYQCIFDEVFDVELDRISKLPGETGYVSELRSLLDDRLTPFGQELGELMQQLTRRLDNL